MALTAGYVVKLGGEIARSPELAADRGTTSRSCARSGRAVVVVHGGGPQATELQEQLGQTPNIVAGRRVTDAATLEVMKMGVAGKVNVDLCAALVRGGGRAGRAARRERARGPREPQAARGRRRAAGPRAGRFRPRGRRDGRQRGASVAARGSAATSRSSRASAPTRRATSTTSTPTSWRATSPRSLGAPRSSSSPTCAACCANPRTRRPAFPASRRPKRRAPSTRARSGAA